MDEEQFAILREWGEGLERASIPELRAAGKAIRMLADEVESLTIELWEARRGLLDAAEERGRLEQELVRETHGALAERLRLRLRRTNESPEA
jgi:hypothetical protein